MKTPRIVAGMALVTVTLGLFPRPVAAEDEAAKVTFQDDALPVLRQRCGSCHNADKKTAGLDVSSYVGIMLGGGSGEVIAPGDASSSYLFRVVTHEDEPTMPPDSPPIPEAEQAILRKWIDGGVLETKGSVAMLPKKKADVAMAGSTMERPEVVPQPARLPLEPAVHTDALDACGSIDTSPWAPLAAVAGQKQVLLYRTDSLEFDGVLPFPEGRPHIVRFSRGGGLVLAGGGVGAARGKVVVWDVVSGRRVQEVGDELDVVLAADISPDQRMIALGGPQRVVRVFSAETGEKLHEHTKHTDWVQAMAYSPDGVLLATADRSGGVFLWEAISGRDYMTITAHPAAVTSVAWRADANLLATGCEDGQIRLWELENGNQVKAWGAHGGGVAALEFTRDGRIASIGRDRVAKLWNAEGAEERSFEAFADLGLAVSFCDETSRVVAGDWTGEIRVFNAADGARVGQLDQNPQPLAERLAVAEQAMAAQRQALAAAEEAITANNAAVAQQQAALDALAMVASGDPQATAEAQEAAARRQELEASIAALRQKEPELAAAAISARDAAATAAASLARWYGEYAFQSKYDVAFAALSGSQVALEQAELAQAEAEAARQAAEQSRQAEETKLGELRGHLGALEVANAASEQEIASLTGRIGQRAGEIMAAEGLIEKSLQAIAALNESAASLDQGLAALPEDAELKAAREAIAGVVTGKQAQLQAQQEALAAMVTEKAAWETSIEEQRAAIVNRQGEMTTVTASITAAEQQLQAAVAEVERAAAAVEQQAATVTERQQAADAAEGALDALQGITS